jgi:hypothetical protein
MTTQQDAPGPAGPAAPAGQAALAGYLEAMEAEGMPLLGHLVLYSVFEGTVTPDQMDAWFTELGLDKKFAPGQIRPVDAFEKITGPSGIRVSYPLDPPPGASPRRRRRRDPQERDATLMIRHVHRDGDRIVRHVVREVRDGAATRLSYDARLAECVFRRDPHPSAEPGAGSLQVTADRAAIAALPPREQDQVRAMLGGIRDAYARHCAYLTADRLRAVIRGYIEALSAIRVRPTGGVYFVHRAHAGTLAALRELVARFGAGSHLSRVPIPDQDEMREMIISAFTTRSREDLDKLARDIAAAQRDGASEAAITALHKRFRELQAATAEHAGLLNTSLDDTTAALKLVNAQLASLLAQAS